MKIIRGKDKGKEVGIHQYCNDWFSASNGKIYGIMSVELEPYEMANLLKYKDKTGFMFEEYYLVIATGRFKRNKK